jgi:hypothetical protein
MFGVARAALWPLVSAPSEAMPVFLFVTFAAGDSAQPSQRLMALILDAGVAVQARKRTAVGGALEFFCRDLKSAFLTSLRVAFGAILSGIGMELLADDE